MDVVKPLARYRWVALGLALLSQWSNALSYQVVAPLAPLFLPELGLTKAEVGLFSSAVFVGSWVVLLVAGSLTDRFGVRKMLSLGQVVGGSLMLAMGAVGSFLQALLVLFSVGVARGSVLPASTKAIMDWFPPSARGTAMGLKQTGVPVAGIVAAAVLPALGLATGWRTAMAVVGLWIIAGGIMTLVLYREASQSGPAEGQKASMRAGVSQLIRNRGVWTLSGMIVLFVAAQNSLITYLPLYFKEVVLVSSMPEESVRIVAAGGYLAFCQAGGVVGRVFWGVASDRVFGGRRLVVLAIVSSITALASVVMSQLGVGSPLWLLTGFVFVYGLNAIGWNGVYHALMVETAGRKYAATGVGLIMTLSQVGLVVGPPLFGFIVDTSGSFQMGWLFLSFVSAGAALTAALSTRGEKHVA